MKDEHELLEQLIVARHAHNKSRIEVEAWLKAEGQKGKLRIASECPAWPMYEAALIAWQEAVEALDRWIQTHL